MIEFTCRDIIRSAGHSLEMARVLLLRISHSVSGSLLHVVLWSWHTQSGLIDWRK